MQLVPLCVKTLLAGDWELAKGTAGQALPDGQCRPLGGDGEAGAGGYL
jgi:hypothetical protein